MGKRLLWRGVSAGAASISVVVTRELVGALWGKLRGESPPGGPADRRIAWGEALTWAVAMGVGVGISRLIAVRVTARVWEAATHEEPPDLP